MLFKRLLSILAALLLAGVAAFAQIMDDTVSWTTSVQPAENDGEYEIIFSGEIRPGWHIYSANDKISETYFENGEDTAGYEITEGLYDLAQPKDDGENLIFEGSAKFGMKVMLTDETATVKGYLSWNACRGGACTPADDSSKLQGS